MWGLFKSFFRNKEQELPKEEIELQKLEGWLDEKTRPVIVELNSLLRSARDAVNKEITEARHNIEVLEQAQLRNPDIPERAKHFMQGNREAYIKRISFFLDSIHFPNEISDYSSFYAAMQEELRELAQGIARPYQILQEFFSDESKQASSSIAVIEREINAIHREAASKAFYSLDSTRAGIKELEFKVNLKKTIMEETASLQKEKEELEKEIEKLVEDISLLKKDGDIKDLEKKQIELKAKIEAARAKIISLFSSIDSAMRKFEKMTYRHREIMQKYIASPLDALMQDLHLVIVKALSDMQAAIKNSRIDLKDRRKDKALEGIQLLTKEYLGNFMTEYGQLKKEEGETARAIEQSGVTLLVKEKKEELEKAVAKRKEMERKTAELEKELEKIDIDAGMSELVKSLSVLTGTAVSIRF